VESFWRNLTISVSYRLKPVDRLIESGRSTSVFLCSRRRFSLTTQNVTGSLAGTGSELGMGALLKRGEILCGTV
jgi:hypothetical protein